MLILWQNAQIKQKVTYGNEISSSYFFLMFYNAAKGILKVYDILNFAF